MGKYLSDKEKESIRQIIMLWDEKGGPDKAPPPTFKEFDADSRTPKANSLAYYFGSFTAAIEKARYYIKHRELVDCTATPEASGTMIVINPKKDTPEAPKPAQKASEEPKKPTKRQNFTFGSALKTEPKYKSPSLKQPIGDLIPAEVEQAITKKPGSKPEVPKEAYRGDDFVNYLPDKIVFIGTDLYQAFIHNEVKLDETAYARESYRHIIPPSDSYATISNSTIYHGRYEVKTDDGPLFVPISSSSTAPQLIKNGLVYRFPEPKPDVYLFVDQAVAEAAANDGRDTDDLFFPKTFVRLKNGTILCAELGKL